MALNKLQDKCIFIIPGYRQSPYSRAYVAIMEALIKKNFIVIPVETSWNNKTISENTAEFIELFNSTEGSKKYILGFSYGAMIAFIAASKIKTDGLILCSLSPFFSEDISKPNSFSKLNLKRYSDFSKLNSGQLAKKLKTKKVFMLYGAREAKELIKRVKTVFENIDKKNKYLLSIKNTDHDIADKKYLNKILEATVGLDKTI